MGDSRFSDEWVCDMCGWDGDMDAAVAHARSNPGHVVTEQLDRSDDPRVGVEVKVPVVYTDTDFPPEDLVDGSLQGTITRPKPELQPPQPREITRN